MVAKLDWNEKYISYDLVQFLIHRQVLAQLLLNIVVLRSFKVPGLSSVKHLAENIGLVTLPLERDWLP